MDVEVAVTGLRVRPLLVTLRRPLDTRVGRFERGPFLALDLETKGGAGGRLLAFTFSPLALKLVPPVLDVLAEAAKEQPITPHNMIAFHDACQKRLTLLGHEGVVQLALSMFDTLVFDALAREAGVPLYRLLGGTGTRVPTYNSCGLGLVSSDEAAQEAQALAAEHGGYTHVKMRLGRSSIDDDVAALSAVRDAVGPELTLSVDFNQGLDAQDALRVCQRIDGLGLAWIEEPIVYDDYDSQARLARKLATPLQIGENWWSWRVGKAAMEHGACDYIMPDILRIGGVTGWMRLARVAEIHAIPFSSHLSPDYSVHVMTATPTAHWLEFMDWGHDLLMDPLVPEAGFARPREAPGAGLEWNEAALSKAIVSV
ncbi:MAG: enolase C-terminal domain-like protein [Pseudomonadota bacterium]